MSKVITFGELMLRLALENDVGILGAAKLIMN